MQMKPNSEVENMDGTKLRGGEREFVTDLASHQAHPSLQLFKSFCKMYVFKKLILPHL